MATSGSWNYSLTAANVIDMAVENLGVLVPGGTIVSAHQTALLRRLNVVAKQFQGTSDGAQGMKVHTRQRITLMLAKGQQAYSIGPASGDARASTAIGRTTLSADEAASQTVLSITSNTDTTTYPGTTITMTASDIVGVELDDGTIQWTTISGTPASTMTVANALTGTAAAGNYVYWFTSRAQRFPVLESAVLRQEGYTTTPLDVYRDARQYDQGVADKYADGSPSCVLCEPMRIATVITLDSQPTDVTEQIVLTVLYPAEDYDATSDDIAFPQEWFRPLAWQLAFEGHSMLGANWTPAMEKNRVESLEIARALNPENSVLYYQPGGL